MRRDKTRFVLSNRFYYVAIDWDLNAVGGKNDGHRVRIVQRKTNTEIAIPCNTFDNIVRAIEKSKQ